MLLQAGSFSKITSIASGQGVLLRGVLLGAGIWTPGGSCGSCERSGSCSVLRESWSLLVSSGILCDMLITILCLSTAHQVVSSLECMAGRVDCQGEKNVRSQAGVQRVVALCTPACERTSLRKWKLSPS